MMEAAKRDSILHRMHPLTKAIFCICMIAIPIITINPFVSLAVLAFLWILAIPAHLQDIFYGTMKKMYPIMLSFIIIMWPLFYRSGTHILLAIGSFHITGEGFYYGLAQALRVAVAITGCMFWIMITEVVDISSSLGRFLQKFGVGFTGPFMFTTSFKFLPEFMSSYSIIKEAFLTRAFQLDKGGFNQKMKNFIPLFIPLMDSSLGKAQNIASAMQLRGFGYTKKRTYYDHFHFGYQDVIFIAIVIFLVVFACWGKSVHLGGFDLRLY